ncbi:TonB-dependent receptor [Polluticaenibacter yanchengensis]|uniref:TonB-dependent receptor n=1 Tax=Polluticaenibacter yanchengensis TaxID=3014562 RepID=A0ABT4UGS0_9BACT|nr:TonB-dependent receptor [Chitinophagaceae bacterium LY-5]
MKNYFIITLVILAASAKAQVKISGRVTDNKKHPVIGASITLKDTYDGGVTDSAGNYSFTSLEKGEYQLEARSMNYQAAIQIVQLSKENLVINFQLKEVLNELTAVTITAGAFEASDRKRAAAVLNNLDIVTVGGANADVTSAIKTLPGAQQVGEQEGLFVRGGAGYETKQFIDGSLVNNPFGTSVPDIASRGRYPSSLFKGTIFSTGGYSAVYGQALSSVLILESIDLPQQSEATVSLSTVFAGGGFQHLAKNNRSSFGVNAGYTNLAAYFNIVKQKPDYFKMPSFYNGDANARFKTKKGMVKYYTNFTKGVLGLRRGNINDHSLKNAIDLDNTNWYHNLSWRETLKNGWKMQLSSSFSTNKDLINQQVQNSDNKPVSTGLIYIDSTNFKLNRLEQLTQAKAVFEKKLPGVNAVRFGAEHWYNNTHTIVNQYDILLKDHLTSVFAETDIHLTNDWAIKSGARLEYSSILEKANISPRISMAYKTGPQSQLSAAYGTFYQKPENNILQYTTQLGFTKSTHYLINWQKTTTAQVFRTEIFYKKYNNLVKTYPTFNTDGDGYAQGWEIFWRDKKSIKNLDYWVSYSFLDTKRDFLRYPGQLQPTFAAKHTASLVTKKFIMKWKTGFNFTYTFATGRPYYFMQENNGKIEIKDQGKTISYNNLGFSANYVPSAGNPNAKRHFILVASVTNLLNSKQVFGYNYNHNGSYKEAINPPAQRFIFLGCFITWGLNRTDEIINNNL